MHDSPGSLLSYTIYSAGVVIGSLSPEQWLIFLSIIAVLVRLPVDLHRGYKAYREFRSRNDDDVEKGG